MPWRMRTGGVVGGPPIVADGVVYVPSADNWVYAVDAVTGRLRWKYQRTSERPIEFWTPREIAVVGGTVFIGEHATRTKPGVMHAVDAHTGQLNWRRELDDHATAFDVTTTDGAVVVQCGNELRCLDPVDGSERWRYAHPALPKGLWAVPVIAGNTVGSSTREPAEHPRRRWCEGREVTRTSDEANVRYERIAAK